MFGRRWTAALALVLLVLAPAAALARTAYVTADLHLRAGPGTSYPIVTTIPDNDAVDVYGCLSSHNWCDVSWQGNRGFVSSNYLTIPQNGTRVVVANNWSAVALPIIGFTLGTYWGAHYHNRPWYAERYRYGYGYHHHGYGYHHHHGAYYRYHAAAVHPSHHAGAVNRHSAYRHRHGNGAAHHHRHGNAASYRHHAASANPHNRNAAGYRTRHARAQALAHHYRHHGATASRQAGQHAGAGHGFAAHHGAAHHGAGHVHRLKPHHH